jgi:hypothetical protein
LPPSQPALPVMAFQIGASNPFTSLDGTGLVIDTRALCETPCYFVARLVKVVRTSRPTNAFAAFPQRPEQPGIWIAKESKDVDRKPQTQIPLAGAT